MSSEPEQTLRRAIRSFASAWRDETDRRPSELQPAHPDKLVELEEALGAPLPSPVRTLLEMFDGSYVPVSPERPDTLLFASAISMGFSWIARRDVVPIIECELDPTTGLNRYLGVSVADPWGPLMQGDGETYEPGPLTLIQWFKQVRAENVGYVWPPRRTITSGLEWSQRTEISEDELAAMPVGTAIATHYPEAKRLRRQLRLCVHLEPGVWVEASARKEKDKDSSPLVELVARAGAVMERKIMRGRSQWALPLTSIISNFRGVPNPTTVRDHFVGSVEIA